MLAPEIRPSADGVRHRVFCPVGHAARIREDAQVSGLPRALELEHARHVFHEDDRDLLARHRQVRLKRRAGRSGDHAGLVRPEDRVLIPVLCEIGKRRRAAHLRLALEVIEDLHDLRARRGQLRPEQIVADAGHQLMRHAVLDAVIGPAVRHVRKHFCDIHDACGRDSLGRSSRRSGCR